MHRPASCLAFLVLPFCVDAQPSGPVQAVVEGHVVNATNNAPIANARVRLTSGPNSVYGKVDRQGYFTFGNLAPGFYRLSVDSPGFLLSDQTLVNLSPPGEAAVQTGAIAHPGSRIPDPNVITSVDADGIVHALVTVPMLAYAVIAGKVTDPYGQPMLNRTLLVSIGEHGLLSEVDFLVSCA